VPVGSPDPTGKTPARSGDVADTENVKMDIQKEKILINLKKFPCTSQVFKKSIEERLSQSDFLENPLIVEVYKDDPGIPDLEELVRYIKESKAFDITQLSKALNGKDSNFDFKMSDFFALLYGVKHFIDRGATDINIADLNIIKRVSEKTPDLRMKLNDRETYAEIKNINEEDKLCTVIFNLLEARSILNPKLYTKQFVIDAITSAVDFDIESYKRLKEMRIKFAQKLEVELSKCKKAFRIEVDNIYFDIKLKPSERYFAAFSTQSLGTKAKIISASDEFLCSGKMYYKTLKKLYDGFLQLLSNRRGNFDQVKNDFIYLRFVGMGSRKIFYEDSLRRRIHNLIHALGFNEIINVVTNLDPE
jgi:hypothetical protein